MYTNIASKKNCLGLGFLASIFIILLAGCSGSEFSSVGCGDGDDCDVGGLSYFWDISDWQGCDKTCGGGTELRTIVCRDTDGNKVPDKRCPGTKEPTSRTCNTHSCAGDYDWLIGSWGACSEVCGGGQRSRSVTCKHKDGATEADNKCPSPKPATSETCNSDPCTSGYYWKVSEWSTCSKTCGTGIRTRTVSCVNGAGQAAPNDSLCEGTRPAEQGTCNSHACESTYTWYTGDWGNCSKTCGGGIQTRTVACLRDNGTFAAESYCSSAGPRPQDTKTCNSQACGPTCSNTKYINTQVPNTSNQLDILIVVDDSGSMAADNQKLAQKLKGFTDDLEQRCNITDWQMCITTTDVDYYEGRAIMWQSHGHHILKAGTPNIHNIITNTMTWIGHGWSSDEQGIKAINLAVQQNNRTKCFRDKAAMSVILISDEDERSVGGNQALSSTQYKPLGALNYPNSVPTTIKTYLGNDKKFNVNSIIVKDAQCKATQDAQGAGAKSFYGTKYQELSNLTGGGVGSICSSHYVDHLKMFANKIVHTVSSIPLQCRPVFTPSVTVTPGHTGQSFNVVDRELIFTPVIQGPANITGSYCCAQ
ncbi:MAG: hypothetical protein M9899_09070 [Bdellovibrionaceae bacterium]|nr:hypothetical protein [Pseudobdellovibrionaceae bacterium]